ncbi:MAG TPA: 2-hydroxy-3-oxopropionate reductase [Candidatus Sulfotelmatobacter sp.]|nr:2-hydroxy-3-oxopropionate reductase [Candidatus Sulfotelmatobacter sp.]
MTDIGFIGLGIMGGPMCRNLLKAGHNVVVHNRSSAPVDRMVELGAARGASSRDVAERSNIVFTMMPDGPEVEEVIIGALGVLEGSRPGSTVVDMSSVNPLISQKIGASCAAKNVRFLDAPVSGGEPKAVDGTLAIMVGGEEAVFREVEPVLQVMGSTVTLTGPVGAGNFAKLANQIIVACNIAAMGEAFVLATRAGLDPNVVLNAIKGGLAGSTVLNAKAPMVISRNFKPGFRIRLHQKDLRNALLAAESMKVSLPLTSAIQQILIALMNQGKGDLDHSAIVTFVEEMASIQIKQPAIG